MIRTLLEDNEEEFLAPYACKSRHTRGRRYPEEKHPYRTDFQRDRERIIYSSAFRRLEYKTQVFVNHEGDHYRTRLTHTIEVAQIARSIARALRLNEDLAEAISLVHDLGHTPFGHSGEEKLKELMEEVGGFEHNCQTLRVVDLLEERYPDFPGLNLAYEVREGIMKHETIYDKPASGEFNPEEQPTLECQAVSFADEIAYNCHDVDDGLYSGVLTEEQLADLDIWKQLKQKAGDVYLQLPERGRRKLMVKLLINELVTDLIRESEAKIKRLKIETSEEVRSAGEPLLTFSKEKTRQNSQLRTFLFANMYTYHKMLRMSDKAKRTIEELFEAYSRNHNLLPPWIRERIDGDHPLIVIGDYIAGMTDRFAMLEHKRLHDPYELV
ncbi:MAG: deoxyguanosinetriphosphate triphosphohydrolase [Candidatus Zixiibacteriota bacterium]